MNRSCSLNARIVLIPAKDSLKCENMGEELADSILFSCRVEATKYLYKHTSNIRARGNVVMDTAWPSDTHLDEEVDQEYGQEGNDKHGRRVDYDDVQ